MRDPIFQDARHTFRSPKSLLTPRLPGGQAETATWLAIDADAYEDNEHPKELPTKDTRESHNQLPTITNYNQLKTTTTITN